MKTIKKTTMALGIICLFFAIFSTALPFTLSLSEGLRIQEASAEQPGFYGDSTRNDFGANIPVYNNPSLGVMGNAAPVNALSPDARIADTNAALNAGGGGGTTTQEPGTCPMLDMVCHAGNFLAKLFLSLGGFILWFGGLLLDLSVKELILNMGYWINEGGIGLAIDHIWSVVRDVVNLMFIFGFVYIGIATILGIGPSWQKFLAQLVIAALLVNFSLFFVKIVIDVANVAALEVYELMGVQEGGIATAFVSQVGLTGFFWPDVRADTLARLSAPGSEPVFYIMLFFFLVVTGVTLAVAAIMIIVRFVALIFIMIGSPLFFVSILFPKTSSMTKITIPMVLSYAFYPAVLLFMLYISLQIMGTKMFSGASTDALVNVFNGAVPSDPNAFTVILQFFVAIALVIMSLRVAKSFSMVGAKTIVGAAEGAMKNVAGAAPKFVIGGAARRAAAGIDDMRRSDNGWARGASLGLRAIGVGAAAGAVSKSKFGTSSSRADDHKTEEGVNRARARAAKITNIEQTIEEGGTNVRATVRGASTEQLVEMLKKHKSGAIHDALIANMSAEQLGNVMKAKDEELDDAAKAGIGAKRKEMLTRSFNGGAGAQAVFAGLQPKDIAKLPREILTNAASVPFLTAAALKAIADADSLSDPADRLTVRNAVIAAHPTVGTTVHPAVLWLQSPGGAIF